MHKFAAVFCCVAFCPSVVISTSYASEHRDVALSQSLEKAKKLQLDQNVSWKRLLYAEHGQSEVEYAGYFRHPEGWQNIALELEADIQALYQDQNEQEAFRCQFPARSDWIIDQLNININDLPQLECKAFNQWFNEIKPHQVTLIYATDFMGNPSSMFGHTLLRIDPKNQKQLNLVSYAVNYAATVNDQDNWSYAWKGLTGQYPGEYSLMPYYRKVKEYGDFESRDLWEYELKLNPQETEFLVKHIWEMKQVKFPYYFIHDNCAYRLLGLIDLVKPELDLKSQFKTSAIPIETIKAVDEAKLIQSAFYRPALETQLLHQARQHGYALAKVAHQLGQMQPEQYFDVIQQYSAEDQAKILEMAYDDVYLKFISRKITEDDAQRRFRALLGLRSQNKAVKQRTPVATPDVDPKDGHHARRLSMTAGRVQQDNFVQLGFRPAYHELIDPQGGYRTGTQLSVLSGAVQWRDDEIKLEQLTLLDVQSLNPISPFKTPMSWGFAVGWNQAAVDHNGQFSEREQHGVFQLNSQLGVSVANASRQHMCYAQVQNHVQAGSALDQGWRVGLGPRIGCQNLWTDHIHSVTEVTMPYWEGQHQWQFNASSQLQYQLSPQDSLRLTWQYQRQHQLDWQQLGLGYHHYF